MTDDVQALQDLVEVVLIHDPDLGSTPETAGLNGKTVLVPRSALPLPQRGKWLGQPGFSRQTVVPAPTGDDPDNTVLRWEWVLQGETSILDQFVDSLTGRGAWTVPASRATVRTTVQALLNRGFTRAQVQNQVPKLYAAIAAEVLAGQQAAVKGERS